MRQAFAKAHGEPEDKHVPSKEYVEKKLSELEFGEFRARALSEMVSREEVDPDVLLPVWDSKGTDIGSEGLLISSYAIWARTATPHERKDVDAERAIRDVQRVPPPRGLLLRSARSRISRRYDTPVDCAPQLRTCYPQVCLQASDPRGHAARSRSEEGLERR